MEIPDYIIKGIYIHYKRLTQHARVDPADHRTVDALRLARKDLRKLQKYIK